MGSTGQKTAQGGLGPQGIRPAARIRGRNALQIGLWALLMGSAALVVMVGFAILQAAG